MNVKETNKQISDLFNKLIDICKLSDDENYIDELDRDYDQNSKNNIWQSSWSSIGFTGEPLHSLLQIIKDTMDKAIKEHPGMSYSNFGFTTEIGHHYEDDYGLLQCDYEWLETDKEKEKRIKSVISDKEEERILIKNSIEQFKKKYNEDF